MVNGSVGDKPRNFGIDTLGGMVESLKFIMVSNH